MAATQSELVVITNAKRLADYVFIITQKSPEHFRLTLTNRMQNYALDIIESLYAANDVYITKSDPAAYGRRLRYQNHALTCLRLLSYMGELAQGPDVQCILPKQFEEMSKRIAECHNTLLGWMASDKRRLTQTNNPNGR